ncbi:hypothetical protein Misp06_03095 [Microbulbifer sp. NBRC 101763]|uniref:hypothetical protein n=1 Tax=Microbulbifer TaxID=48073 RepID=UPI0003721EA9|nr:hypothetical protein [Microbulbifer variabilis]
MIQALLASGIVFGLLKLFERGKDRGLDGFTSIAFVLVPELLIFLATIGTGIAGINQQFLVALVALYFIVPTLMLRLQFELSWKQSALYGLLVLLVVVAVDTLFYLLLSAATA